MAKSKKQRKKRKIPANQNHSTTSRAQQQEEETRKFGWIPLWGWILIFVAPLALSEFMFYAAGRTKSMILFPVAWIGFWVTIMVRSGWPIIKKRDKKRDDQET